MFQDTDLKNSHGFVTNISGKSYDLYYFPRDYSIFTVKYTLFLSTFLAPATKLGQGYVFTDFCDSVHGGAGST